MKKLILLGVLAAVVSYSAPASAQVFVNVNIGTEPRYAPVRYTNTDYYYSGPRTIYVNRAHPVYVSKVHPVYVNKGHKSKYKKQNKWKPAKSHYVTRPISYQRAHYKDNRGPKAKHYKAKSHKRDRGIERIVGSRGKR